MQKTQFTLPPEPSSPGTLRQYVGEEAEHDKLSVQIRAAFSKVLFLVAVGLLLGIVCILTSEHLKGQELNWKTLYVVLEEIGIGLVVAAFSVFGYELLLHISRSFYRERELRASLVTLEQAIDEIKSRTPQASRGLPDFAVEGTFKVLDHCVAERPCLKDYRVQYKLGRLNDDGYRTIMVSYSYQHLQRSDRKFKFGCVLPASRLESHPLSKAGYEVLWSFLGSPTTTALPKGAFKVNRLQVKTASSPPKSILMESIISYDDRLEVESRDVISLSPGDIVLCDFTVLQYDDFRFVADRIDECVWGYTVDCRRGDAGDIGAIFPLALFSASEEPAIRVDQDDLVTASVSSEGWVIPSGAAIFSWSPKVRTVVNSDLPSVDAAALALMKELGARSQGTFFDLGPATEALKAVGMRMAEAAKVQNTFIGQNVPYSPESRDLVEGVLAQLLKRNIYYEETCSFSRRDRVDRLWNKLQGIIPATYKARILREELSGMPACNFTIVTHDASRSFQEEVFFGWGFFEHSANDHVFWSNDVRLISFFRDYHQALRHPSVSDEYAPGATGPIPQQ